MNLNYGDFIFYLNQLKSSSVGKKLTVKFWSNELNCWLTVDDKELIKGLTNQNNGNRLLVRTSKYTPNLIELEVMKHENY